MSNSEPRLSADELLEEIARELLVVDDGEAEALALVETVDASGGRAG